MKNFWFNKRLTRGMIFASILVIISACSGINSKGSETSDRTFDKYTYLNANRQGTISLATFSTNNKLAEIQPQSWNDLKHGNSKIIIGDVVHDEYAQLAVLSAAIAFGGNASNIEPGIAFFEELAKQGRLTSGEAWQGDESETEVNLVNQNNGLIPSGLLGQLQIKDHRAWEETSYFLPDIWRDRVLTHMH